MLTCNLLGGLGNQLFQIFTTIAVALQYNIPFLFLDNEFLGLNTNATVRHTYWNSFLYNLFPFIKSERQLSNCVFTHIHEKTFTYNPITIDPKANTILYGYYQSPLYFDRYKNNICKLIKLNELTKLLLTKYNNKYNLNNCISMHFRLGDYKLLPDFHPVLNKEYYKNALEYIIQTAVPVSVVKDILFFCEKSDYNEVMHTINWLKELFPLLRFICIDFLLEDWEQLLFMSMCKHNIIANSTFSWWGAYLNTSEHERIVCYPKQWFGPKLSHNTKDLFPVDWIKIDCN